MTENEIASIVVDAALKIHKTLGPGFVGIRLPGHTHLRATEARITSN